MKYLLGMFLILFLASSLGAQTQVQYDQTVWPTDSTVISDPFGPRIKESEEYRYDFHKGIDIKGNNGDPVYSVADGEVFRVYHEPNTTYPDGGNVIVVRHTADVPFVLNGQSFTTYYTLYMHLKDILVQDPIPGDSSTYTKVLKGQQIGTIGNSGTTDFNHLHFEVRVGTTCSITSDCSKGYDPHVNPFYFLSYNNLHSLKYTITKKNPLTVLVESSRNELDFDEIVVIQGKKQKRIEFTNRIGLDPYNLDFSTYNNVTILPGVFNSETSKYQITFVFNDIVSTTKSQAKVTIKDIWDSN